MCAYLQVWVASLLVSLYLYGETASALQLVLFLLHATLLLFRKTLRKNQNMALDDSQILVQSFSAAKELIKRGSLSADDKVILGSYPQETYHHKDSPVLKQTS